MSKSLTVRLSRLEIVWRAPREPRLEVVPGEDEDGHRWLSVRSVSADRWTVVDPAAWELL